MGWIANLKKGAPAHLGVETIVGASSVNPNIPVTLVDSSGGVVSVTIGKPQAVNAGYIKTIISSAGSANVTVQAETELKRDNHGGTSDVAVLTEIGGCVRFIWDGSKWCLIPGDSGSSALDIALS